MYVRVDDFNFNSYQGRKKNSLKGLDMIETLTIEVIDTYVHLHEISFFYKLSDIFLGKIFQILFFFYIFTTQDFSFFLLMMWLSFCRTTKSDFPFSLTSLHYLSHYLFPFNPTLHLTLSLLFYSHFFILHVLCSQ